MWSWLIITKQLREVRTSAAADFKSLAATDHYESTFGGSRAPGAYAERTSTTTANLQTGKGGGVTYTPSSPAHVGGTGTLTVTGSTFSRNTAAGIGGAVVTDLICVLHRAESVAAPQASAPQTFSNNSATGTGES